MSIGLPQSMLRNDNYDIIVEELNLQVFRAPVRQRMQPMPEFDYTFTVRAPLPAVAEFHSDTRALKRLTPPPAFVQIHDIEALGEGSVSEFTMWFGPLPVRWVAVHSNVSQHGFTDRQERGLLRRWEHTHTFHTENESSTRISEHIEYEHDSGARGLLSRVLFSRSALSALFTYRKLVTRRWLARKMKRSQKP